MVIIEVLLTFNQVVNELNDTFHFGFTTESVSFGKLLFFRFKASPTTTLAVWIFLLRDSILCCIALVPFMYKLFNLLPMFRYITKFDYHLQTYHLLGLASKWP